MLHRIGPIHIKWTYIKIQSYSANVRIAFADVVFARSARRWSRTLDQVGTVLSGCATTCQCDWKFLGQNWLVLIFSKASTQVSSDFRLPRMFHGHQNAWQTPKNKISWLTNQWKIEIKNLQWSTLRLLRFLLFQMFLFSGHLKSASLPNTNMPLQWSLITLSGYSIKETL